MPSGRDRLLTAARSLLSAQPDREPSTREIYTAAGVGAPTLYHHFGDKDGLLDAAIEDAFGDYLSRKRMVPQTGDLLADFAAGWDMHVRFGVENPALYRLMYSANDGRRSSSAETAEKALREGLERLAAAGILTVSIDEAVAMTTATAIGCVTELVRTSQPAEAPVAHRMRDTLIAELSGGGDQVDDAAKAARTLLSRMPEVEQVMTSPEAALLGQWLRTLAAHFDQAASTPPHLKGHTE
ncbi:TetR/AcrR family transcriptional regulator [Gryllotalpicola daejeonensis]